MDYLIGGLVLAALFVYCMYRAVKQADNNAENHKE